MNKFLILGVAALAISACSEKGADTDGDGKISNSEASAEMAKGGAMAMKPGLWEVKIGFDKIDDPRRASQHARKNQEPAWSRGDSAQLPHASPGR